MKFAGYKWRYLGAAKVSILYGLLYFLIMHFTNTFEPWRGSRTMVAFAVALVVSIVIISAIVTVRNFLARRHIDMGKHSPPLDKYSMKEGAIAGFLLAIILSSCLMAFRLYQGAFQSFDSVIAIPVIIGLFGLSFATHLPIIVLLAKLIRYIARTM